MPVTEQGQKNFNTIIKKKKSVSESKYIPKIIDFPRRKKYKMIPQETRLKLEKAVWKPRPEEK